MCEEEPPPPAFVIYYPSLASFSTFTSTRVRPACAQRKRCSEVERACRAERARARAELTLTLMLARALPAFGSFRVFSASVKGVG